MKTFLSLLVVCAIGFQTPVLAQQRNNECLPRDELISRMAEADGQTVVVAQINDLILLEIFSNGSDWVAYYSSAEGISCLVASGVGEVMTRAYECRHPIACPNV